MLRLYSAEAGTLGFWFVEFFCKGWECSPVLSACLGPESHPQQYNVHIRVHIHRCRGLDGV